MSNLFTLIIMLYEFYTNSSYVCGFKINNYINYEIIISLK